MPTVTQINIRTRAFYLLITRHNPGQNFSSVEFSILIIIKIIIKLLLFYYQPFFVLMFS
jgi:hypothetical protein